VRIKAHIGMSVDGFVATRDGVPSLIQSPVFVPGKSHGDPEFIDGCDAVLMGRQTFLPALSAQTWPWADMRVFVLTSRPLAPETPGPRRHLSRRAGRPGPAAAVPGIGWRCAPGWRPPGQSRPLPTRRARQSRRGSIASASVRVATRTRFASRGHRPQARAGTPCDAAALR